MRRQDEIRLLFPEQTPSNKKFLLSELDRFAQAFDADDVLELLRGQLGTPDAGLSIQSLVTTTLFLPSYVQRRHGVAGEEQGVWSQFLGGPGAKASPIEVAKNAEATRLLRDAAVERLTPLMRALVDRLDGMPERARLVVHLALALLPGGHVLLAERIDRQPRVETVWAWAVGGGATRDPERLVAHLARHGPGQPDLLLAALPLPPASVESLAQRVAGRLDWMGIAHLATATAYAGGSHALNVLTGLAGTRTGWGDVYVLRALEALGHPTGLDLVHEIAGRTQQEFVKQQAVRTAGSFTTERALKFCLGQLGTTETGVTAQALESLVRMRCPRDELAAAARPFLASRDLRVRVNALLASVDPVEGKFPQGFGSLVKADEALPRIEAAFCLGYWQSQSALEILRALASSDTHPLVRTQATKSLSKYPVAHSIPVLTRLVEAAPPAGAAVAARVMSRLADRAVAGVTEFFTRALAEHADPARRALLLTALAGLKVTSKDAHTEEVFAAALDVDSPEVLGAALEGWMLLGGPTNADIRGRLARLANGADPALWGASRVVAVLAGDLDVVDALAKGVAAADEARLAATAQAALELVLISSCVLGPQHKPLAAALVDRIGAAPAIDPSAALSSRVGIVPQREDGEFIVRSASEATGKTPGAAIAQEPAPTLPAGPELSASLGGTPGAPGAISDSLLRTVSGRTDAPLRAKKSGRIAGKGDVGRALLAANYLVAGKAQLDALEAESRSARWLRNARRVTAFLRENPVLLVPPVVLLLIPVLGLVSLLAPAPVLEVRAPVALTVISAGGAATLAAGGAPLRTADVLRTGDVLVMDRADKSKLTTPNGGRIVVEGPARLEIKARAEGGVVLVVVEGILEVDAPTEFVYVAIARTLIESEGGSFIARVDKATATVEPRSGGVRAIDRAGARTDVPVGKPHAIR